MTQKDPGYQLVLISRLSEICDPFVTPPWEGVASLTLEGVRQAIEDELHLRQPYSARARSKPWSVIDHIARIAYLATAGWEDPIQIDVAIPSDAGWADWMISDGNHRLAAAIVRGDKTILAHITGCSDHVRKLLG